MECTLEGGNARTLAKAIQSLAKFGTDLFLEMNSDFLQFRTLNNSRTAMGTLKFSRSFFDTFDIKADEEKNVKVSMKQSLAVFRNMRQVERCEIQIVPSEAKFDVRLKCLKLETVKKASIAILDEEIITASVDNNKTMNIISGAHKVFTELAANFNSADEEITFEAKVNSLTVKNYIEGSRVNDKFMRSQLKLSSAEFNKYKIERETAVTFSMREFRAFLLFAETLNINLTLHFNGCGSPLFIHLKKNYEIDCILVMSTLSHNDVSFYNECGQRNVGNKASTSNSTATKRRMRDAGGTPAEKTRKCIAESSTLSNTDTELFQFNNSNGPSCSISLNSSLAIPRNLTENIYSASNSLPHCEAQNALLTLDENTEIGGDGDCIAESPQKAQQRRELRSIFSRCFEATYKANKPSPGNECYVRNSDNEND